jgi:hypothetical protein
VLNTGASNAINLTTLAGSVSFVDSVKINTAGGFGINASGGGSLTVSGTHNSIVSSANTALSVVGTAGDHLGGSLSFRSVTAGGGTKGVSVQYLDGPVTISGDQSGDNLPENLTSGGTITGGGSMTRGAEFIGISGAVTLGGMTFTNATQSQTVSGAACGLNLNVNNNTSCNAPLYLESTTGGVTLSKLAVSGSVQGGINGYLVTNLVMSEIEVSGVGNEVGENGILMKNLTGVGSATTLNLHNNASRQLHILNTAGKLTAFPITASIFANTVAPNGGQGILLETYNSGTSLDVSVAGSQFSSLFSNALQLAANTGSVDTVAISSSTFTNVNSWTVLQASDGGTSQFAVTGNSGVTGALSGSSAIVVKTDNADLAGPGSVANGSIVGNVIGGAAVGSGAACGGGCSGISMAQRDGGTMTVSVVGNTVQHVDARGIDISGGNSFTGNAGKLVVTLTGNLIRNPDGGVLAGVHLQSGTQSGDTNCYEANVGGTFTPGSWPSQTAGAKNRIEGNWDPTGAPTFSAGNEIFVWRRFTSTMNIPGATPSAAAWLTARNSFNSVDGSSVGVSGATATGTCP